jgi:hypothetical protein
MSQQTGKRNIFRSCLEALLFGGIFLVIGGGLSYWGWNIVQNAQASSAWPTTDGTVTSSEVVRVSDADGGVTYSPEVTYSYSVDNVQYVGDTISFGENTYSSKRKAEGISADYPVGKAVTVYHDPLEPEVSVLEPGVSGGSYIALAVGVVFILIGLITAVLIVIFRKY